MKKGVIEGTTARSLMANRSTVQRLPNGQITLNIPRAIAHAMGYQKGDIGEFEIQGGKIVLNKQQQK
jgi:hypothetical protein